MSGNYASQQGGPDSSSTVSQITSNPSPAKTLPKANLRPTPGQAQSLGLSSRTQAPCEGRATGQASKEEVPEPMPVPGPGRPGPDEGRSCPDLAEVLERPKSPL